MENESLEKLNELRAVNQALPILADHVFALKEQLAPKRAEWNGKTDARRMALGNIYQPCLTTPILMFNLLVNTGAEEDLQTFAKLRDVISHEKIVRISGPIMDQFAWSDDKPAVTSSSAEQM